MSVLEKSDSLFSPSIPLPQSDVCPSIQEKLRSGYAWGVCLPCSRGRAAVRTTALWPS